MRVNLQNIVNSAVERGIVEGYTHITSDKFKGNAEDAVGCLFYSVMENIGEYLLFDEDEQPSDKKIGFNANTKTSTDLRGELIDTDNDSEQFEQKIKIANRIKKVKFKR